VRAVSPIVEAALTRRARRPSTMALLAGLSGIDGSGKGYLAGHVVTALSARRMKTAAIDVDRWLNLPAVRFDRARPAENFYENALRLDDIFARLVVPLQRDRSVCVTMDSVEETAASSRPYTYQFDDLDIIVLIAFCSQSLSGHAWSEDSCSASLSRPSRNGATPTCSLKAKPSMR
jgi:hypothetical protein